jgi:hypothetical protein
MLTTSASRRSETTTCLCSDRACRTEQFGQQWQHRRLTLNILPSFVCFRFPTVPLSVPRSAHPAPLRPGAAASCLAAAATRTQDFYCWMELARSAGYLSPPLMRDGGGQPFGEHALLTSSFASTEKQTPVHMTKLSTLLPLASGDFHGPSMLLACSSAMWERICAHGRCERGLACDHALRCQR